MMGLSKTLHVNQNSVTCFQRNIVDTTSHTAVIQPPSPRDISLIKRNGLHNSCVRSSMLHGSETWPVRKENEVALQRAEMRKVRWMCNVKVKDRVPSKELRERLGIGIPLCLIL